MGGGASALRDAPRVKRWPGALRAGRLWQEACLQAIQDAFHRRPPSIACKQAPASGVSAVSTSRYFATQYRCVPVRMNSSPSTAAGVQSV